MTGKRRTPTRAREPAPESARDDFFRFVLRVLDEKRAEEIVCLDVGKVTTIADSFVIATVSSPRQSSALREEIEKERKKRGLPRVGIEGEAGSGWVILDYGSLVVHLFGPEQRAYYALEHLWSDAPKLPFP